MAFDLGVLLKLLVSVILGGLVGLERQAHGRAAGLRTHILVSLGATLTMIVTQSFTQAIDPGRAVAGILTGIGFLGAGVIVKSNEIVRGLTTAACIWFVATLGILVGQSMHVVAALSTALSLAILTLLSWFSSKIPSVSYHTVVVRSATRDVEALDSSCREMFAAQGFRIIAASSRLAADPVAMELTFRLRTRHVPNTVRASRPLLALPGVRSVDWD
ncbi:MAG: MgtC/SapB family protein [Candidatus Bipolaricaulota bacterium]